MKNNHLKKYIRLRRHCIKEQNHHSPSLQTRERSNEKCAVSSSISKICFAEHVGDEDFVVALWLAFARKACAANNTFV